MNRKKIIVVTLALLLSNAMAGLDGTIINTALPSIISDLHGIEYMGWIVSVFLLAMAVVTPLWSKLGERIGNKKAYQLATMLFAIGSVLQASATNIFFFLGARAIMGIGAGGMNTIPFIIYAELFEDVQKRAKVIGYATASYSAASILGPLVGGFIVDTFSWHWVFYINVPIAILSIVCVQFFLKEKSLQQQKEKVDYAGAVFMVLGLVFLLLGIQMIEAKQMLQMFLFFAMGFIFLLLLFYVEGKAKDPIIPNRLFKNRILVGDFLLFSLLWGAFVSFNIYVPMWAQGLLGLTALLGGLTQVPGSFTNFGGAMAGPSIQAKFGKYKVVSFGTISFILAFVLLSFAGIKTPLWVLFIAGAFEGFGLGMCFNTLQISVQQAAEKKDVPIATSFAFLLRILSQTLMSSVYGVILNNALLKGVKSSHGKITMAMMNKLSDAKTVRSLPENLIPNMREILFLGLHHIMFVALGILVLSLVFNVWLQKKVNRRLS